MTHTTSRGTVSASSGPRLPVDAATLILVDRSAPVPKVLLGKRHDRHVFMPGKFVFPGGRVESDDAIMPVVVGLPPTTEAQLRRDVDTTARPQAFPLAAIRETFEETGLILGTHPRNIPGATPETWRNFASHGFFPDLSALHFVMRAITPPGFHRRFDARFFTADIDAVAYRAENVVHADAELVELTWVSIAEAQNMDLPTITHIVLEELKQRVAAGLDRTQPVPFYHVLEGRFERTLLP